MKAKTKETSSINFILLQNFYIQKYINKTLFLCDILLKLIDITLYLSQIQLTDTLETHISYKCLTFICAFKRYFCFFSLFKNAFNSNLKFSQSFGKFWFLNVSVEKRDVVHAKNETFTNFKLKNKKHENLIKNVCLIW